jgi:hypothetical protein
MRGARVQVVKTTQDGRRRERRGISGRHRSEDGRERARNMLPESLMWPQVIVEGNIFLHSPTQLLLVSDEHVIEALSLQASDEALTGGIGPQRLNRRLQFLDARAPGDG